MRVLFVASEGLPYIKSGGLADVIGSVPSKIQTKAVAVDIIMPLYQAIINKWIDKLEYVNTFRLEQAIFHTDVRIFKHEVNHVTTYFVENREYFERDELYGYDDDGARFSFFQHAVMNFVLHMDETYDVLHCHDWHTGMIPVLGKTLYRWHNKISHLKYVYTIHNLAFQGNFPVSVLTDCFGLTMDLIYDNSLNFHNGMSFMKGGIFYSDKVTTVSKTYAEEILTAQFGEQMDFVLRLRKDDLSGIVNGIDTKLWNPKTDALLDQKYDQKSLHLKTKNKLALQEQYGLEINADLPLYGLVSRLTNQKGINLVIEKLHALMTRDLQIFILGTGDKQYEEELAYLASCYPGRFIFYRGYNEALAHKIYAASDFFLMPSYFEPCGISQLISLRYGTLPIVRETGGLKDTVAPYNRYTKEGTGFTFSRFDGSDMFDAILRSLDLYRDKESLAHVQLSAMNENVDWRESARAYRELYRSI